MSELKNDRLSIILSVYLSEKLDIPVYVFMKPNPSERPYVTYVNENGEKITMGFDLACLMT